MYHPKVKDPSPICVCQHHLNIHRPDQRTLSGGICTDIECDCRKFVSIDDPRKHMKSKTSRFP